MSHLLTFSCDKVQRNIKIHRFDKKDRNSLKEAFLSVIKKKYIGVNYCKKLLGNTKKECFQELDTKMFSGNKTFWRTVAPFFSKKN